MRRNGAKLPTPPLILPVMATLSSIRKQIQRLEAEATRIAREEMGGAISKIKALMTDFGITLEHLSSSAASAPAKKRTTAKKAVSKPASKTSAAGRVRYADPKTGKTWSGFGRAPGWIAGAKNRDAFLVGATASAAPTTKAAPAKRVKSKAVAVAADAPAVVAKKVTKAAKKVVKTAKKTTTAPKKAVAAKKSAAAKKSVAKKVPAKKAAGKKVGRKTAGSAAGTSPATETTAAAAAAE